MEGDFSRVFILTDNKPLDDRDIQAVIELADIYLENILFPNGDISSLMMTADDEDLNNPLLDLGLSKQTTPDESHHSPGFIHHHIESSNSSISTTQHLDKYFDAMFDSTEEDSSLQQLHADSNSSFSKPEIQQKQNAVAIGGLPMELVQGSHLPLEAEHNNSVEVSQNKVLSLKKPSDDELSAASLLSTRFQEPASSSSVSSLSGNYDAGQMKTEDDETAKDSPTSRSAAIPILNPNPNSSSTCNFDIDPHSQMIPKQNFSGNTTTLSTSSSPSLSFLQNEWAFSNSTSPIWMEYATCMLRSAPASPNSNIKNGILRKCA